MSETAIGVIADDTNELFPSDDLLRGGMEGGDFAGIPDMWLRDAHSEPYQNASSEPDQASSLTSSETDGKTSGEEHGTPYQDFVQELCSNTHDWFGQSMPNLSHSEPVLSPVADIAETLDREEYLSKLRPNRNVTVVDPGCDKDDSGEFDPDTQRREQHAQRQASKKRAESLRKKKEKQRELPSGDGEGIAEANERPCDRCCTGGRLANTNSGVLGSEVYDTQPAPTQATKESDAKTRPALPVTKPSADTSTPKTNITPGSKLWKPATLLGLRVSPSCAFCSSGLYTMLGKDYSDEPAEAGTKLCKTCVAKRNAILQCGDHLVSRSKTLPKVNFSKMANRMMRDRIRPDDPWCDVCPGQAEHECGKVTDWGRGHSGCGLKLCGACAEDLAGHGNSWKMFMLDMFARPWRRLPFGIRADAEVLIPDAQL